MKTIIEKFEAINNFFMELEIFDNFSIPTIRHLKGILLAIILGVGGKMTRISKVTMSDERTISAFLNNQKWDEDILDTVIKKAAYAKILDIAQKTNNPIIVSADDTAKELARPSSEAINTIEIGDDLYSHLLGKNIYGHQYVAIVLSCGEYNVCYDLKVYDKSESTKIKIVLDAIESLPIAIVESYVCFDSWFAAKEIINASEAKGYHVIGAVRTNRIIFPKGIRIQIKAYAEYIQMSDVSLVTVNKRKYHVYRYEGPIYGIENIVVLITWPQNAFKLNAKVMKAFICTNVGLSTSEILNTYSLRWTIEIFFRSMKALGLDQCQIHTKLGIKRYLLIYSFMYLFCCYSSEVFSFTEGRNSIRNQFEIDQISYIINCAHANISTDEIIKSMIS